MQSECEPPALTWLGVRCAGQVCGSGVWVRWVGQCVGQVCGSGMWVRCGVAVRVRVRDACAHVVRVRARARVRSMARVRVSGCKSPPTALTAQKRMREGRLSRRVGEARAARSPTPSSPWLLLPHACSAPSAVSTRQCCEPHASCATRTPATVGDPGCNRGGSGCDRGGSGPLPRPCPCHVRRSGRGKARAIPLVSVDSPRTHQVLRRSAGAALTCERGQPRGQQHVARVPAMPVTAAAPG
jgi:hypothetical protein